MENGDPLALVERLIGLPEAQRGHALAIYRLVGELRKAQDSCVVTSVVGAIAGLILGGVLFDVTGPAFGEGVDNEYAFALLLPWLIIGQFFSSLPHLFGGVLLGGLLGYVLARQWRFRKKKVQLVSQLRELRQEEPARAALTWLTEHDKEVRRVVTRHLAEALI